MLDTYNEIRSGRPAFYEQKRGLIAVWGKEAVQFLDGMITNDIKTLEDGQQMLAAFPNAQGRLIAVVRILRQGDRYLIETEEATRENLFQNLFRFTFAGDFFVEDLSDAYQYFEFVRNESIDDESFSNVKEVFHFRGNLDAYFVPMEDGWADNFRRKAITMAVLRISDDLYETLRMESGIPKFGLDIDETTVVPELGFDDMISYKKGCYIGQEIIARIHFRGHVAKQLTGVILSEPGAIATGFLPGVELTTLDGKSAGRVTSTVYSPRLKRSIGLALVRYDYLSEGTVLLADSESVTVKNLPFIT